MAYPYMNYNYNYGYNNYNRNLFGYNYSSPVEFCGGYTSVPSQMPVKKTVSTPKIDSTSVTNPVKSKPANPQINDNNNLGNEFIKVARKYSNCAETDGSHLKFCINPTCQYEDPNNEEWCTDFVTYVVKEAYKNQGKTPPEGFGNHDVMSLKNWAIFNKHFIRTNNQPKKAEFIAQNIKPGDIMIINENNYSHTGFVTKIDSNGVIHTIEGNRDDRVKEHSYSPDYPNLSGFIRLTF